IGKVRLYQNINIEVDIAQHVINQYRRSIDVAVIQTRPAGVVKKSKNVVPAIEPVIFLSPCSSPDASQQRMVNVVFKLPFKNNERTITPCQPRGPAAILSAVIFEDADRDSFRCLHFTLP